MTASELIAKAINLVEEDYPNETWEHFIEDVLSDMNTGAKVLKAEDIPVIISGGDATINVASTLPTLYEIVDISFKPTGERSRPLKRLPAFDGVSMGWKRVDNNTVVLQNLPFATGGADIKYYEKLTLTASTVSSGDYTFNLPEKYHEVLFKGVCAYAMQKEEELDRKNDFYGEYMIGKRRMLVERVSEVEPWNKHLVAEAGGKK